MAKSGESPQMEAEKPMLRLWHRRETFCQKPRLPKTLSWVIGLRHLSERFADIPQFSGVEVRFDDHPVDETTITVAKAIADSIPQQVFSVRYWSWSWRIPGWDFCIYPVEAGRRSHVRQLLEEQAFPFVEQWLKAERPETWLQANKHLHCIWDRLADRIEVKEALR